MAPAAFSIRVASIDDEPGVRELLQASYPALMRSAYEEAILEPALERMTEPNPTLLVSETYYLAVAPAGSIIGCGGWTRERPGSGDIEPGLGHLRHFGTHPDWSGRGVGRSIYQMCERAARDAGITDFECCSSLNAEGFYRSLGFEPIQRVSVDLGPKLQLPSILMRRSIRPVRSPSPR